MKTIKLSLAVIVVAAITFFVIRSFVTTDEVDEIKPSGNPFIDKIQQEIKTLQLKPENKFCRDYYNEVVYHIDDYHKNNRLGKSKLENDRWKDNLSDQLYAAYADKFIKQAFYVFNRSDWEGKDLGFIRSEYRALQSSPLLERNSPIDRRFNEIKVIFNKYNEITDFISSCKGFSFPQKELGQPYPVEDIRTKIAVAKSYQDNHLENSYVNNCTRLHSELAEIPDLMFSIHVKYLDNKISYWSGMYIHYSSQIEYANFLFNPLNTEIDALDNDIYNVSEFRSELERLNGKLDLDAQKAYIHFSK